MDTISIARFKSRINEQKGSVTDVFKGNKTVSSYIQNIRDSSHLKKEFKKAYKNRLEASEGKIGEVSTFILNQEGTKLTNTFVHTQNGPIVRTITNGFLGHELGTPKYGTKAEYSGITTLIDHEDNQMLGLFDVRLTSIPNTKIESGAVTTEHIAEGVIITETGLEIMISDRCYADTPQGIDFDFINEIKNSVDPVINQAGSIFSKNNAQSTQNEMYMQNFENSANFPQPPTEPLP